MSLWERVGWWALVILGGLVGGYLAELFPLRTLCAWLR